GEGRYELHKGGSKRCWGKAPIMRENLRSGTYKAALEDIAAVLGQSPEWGADQLNEIVAILGREGIPVSE
ncbi:hypothetical protein, partial [Azotobacter beijerinckii]|uniref:hypothetical protein n=1 Tax=Azotobacter beijerinckii TaxID=170623 RepID=UPI001587FD46